MPAADYQVPVMHQGQVTAKADLVRQLLEVQFPQWARLELTAIPGGTDHAMFRLGDCLLARFPLTADRGHPGLDARWLPLLAPHLSLEVPAPLGLGEPALGYPWQWTVTPWIAGTTVGQAPLDMRQAALDLARFIRHLHAIPPLDGPVKAPGQRGAPVHHLDGSMRRLIAEVASDIDAVAVADLWDRILEAPAWEGDPVWVHTDIGPDNVIVRDGRVVAVIDFGIGVGDPAPDVLPAWLIFEGDARALFLKELGYDSATILRALAWLLAPAVQGLVYYRGTRPEFVARSHRNIATALSALDSQGG